MFPRFPLDRVVPARSSLISVALLVVAMAVSAVPLRAAPPETLEVAMRDGVKLATDVYLPDGDGPWPCVLARTPYGKNGVGGVAKVYVQAGYALVVQDCRGRHESEGEYDPFRTDPADGHDTVEWIARQEWSDGAIGMWGASAVGMTANLAATQRPPHLKCAYVIVAPASARRNTVYIGGVYRKELNDGWLAAQGATGAIAETIRHPAADAHWDWREIPDFHTHIDIPIYNVGGWFDIFAQGTLDNFRGLQRRGAGLAAGNQKLLMGPWAHGGLGGKLEFPDSDASVALDPRESIRWFDRWLKGEENGIDEEPPVRYYVLGDPGDADAPGNEWRRAKSWPPPSRPVSFFLGPQHSLSRGELPAESGNHTYEYDPQDPVPTLGGGNLIAGGKGPMDQRLIRDRDDYLRFQTEPLARPLEVVGRITVDLYIDSDAPDTDFAAKLVDVYPDGYEALICDGILRTRYREGLGREVFLEAGTVVKLRIDLWSTAIVFNRGHRIALHVSSSNNPRFDPNPNTGKPLRSDEETRVATNTVHFGPRRPSRLLLPVVKEHDVEQEEGNAKTESDPGVAKEERP